MASIFRVGDRWRVQVRRKGHATLSETFATKQDAQRWAREKEHGIDKGKSTPIGLRLTVGHIVQTYIDNLKVAGRSKRQTLEKLAVSFAGVRLEEFTQLAIMNYVTKREGEIVENQGPGAGQVALLNELSYLRTALRFGGVLCEAGEATALALARLQLAHDFLWHAERIAVANQRDRRPSPDELQKIRNWFCTRRRMQIPMWEITLFAMATAMRIGEIVGPKGVRWEDLDLNNHTIWIRKRKISRGLETNDQLIPLLKGPLVWDGEVVDPVDLVLSTRTADVRTGRIFPYNKTRVSTHFKTACDKNQIVDLHFHDLRHDAVSRMFEYGLQIPEVALVSGHKSWKNLKRYTNLKPVDLHKKMVNGK